jgi:hypothetical protein
MKKNLSKELMADLYDVGTKKALGYLPVQSITKHGHDTVENVIRWAATSGRKYRLFTQAECHVESGALYVWDHIMLLFMINENKGILNSAGIPTEPANYVDRIARQLYPQQEYPEVYRFIGRTFNDERFRAHKHPKNGK